MKRRSKRPARRLRAQSISGIVARDARDRLPGVWQNKLGSKPRSVDSLAVLLAVAKLRTEPVILAGACSTTCVLERWATPTGSDQSSQQCDQ